MSRKFSLPPSSENSPVCHPTGKLKTGGKLAFKNNPYLTENTELASLPPGIGVTGKLSQQFEIATKPHSIGVGVANCAPEWLLLNPAMVRDLKALLKAAKRQFNLRCTRCRPLGCDSFEVHLRRITTKPKGLNT